MERTPIDDAFFKMVENIHIDLQGYHDLEPVDDVRELLLGKLKQHIDHLRDTGAFDEVNHDEAMQMAANLINRDLMEIDRLRLNDEVIASGDAVFLVVGPDDERESPWYDLSGGFQLRGAVGQLLVEQISHEKALAQVKSVTDSSDGAAPQVASPEQLDSLENIGLFLEIVDASYINSHGDERELPADALVLLLLNHSQLQLKRFVE